MARVDDIHERMAAMEIEDDENEGLCFGEEVEEFFHVDDMQWVLSGGPWSFDGAMLVISTIDKGVDPLEVPLFDLPIWIQLHGLPNGFMTEAADKQLGDFFGSFLLYDPNNNSSIWRECMRIKTSIDVRKPLKRKKKICRRNGAECIVQCKYERLGDFCFTCGMVTHTERFCSKRLSMGTSDSLREWGTWLRAPSRRMVGQERSKWLREEKDEDWGANYGDVNQSQKFSKGMTAGDGVKGQSRSEVRDWANSNAIISVSDAHLIYSNSLEGNNIPNKVVGPSEQELDGLNMANSKRKRGPGVYEYMELENGNVMGTSETALSHRDCAASLPELLAKLAQQASQSK
ncbi:hypothetical protein AgCh_030511 [Apium graveolens]